MKYINVFYYSFKIFTRFWLVKTTRIILHNQLLLTKFGKNFMILHRWRQNDIKCAAWLQVIEPLTEKTLGRGSVALTENDWTVGGTFYSFHGEILSWTTHGKNSMKTDDICYLEYICRSEQTFPFSPKLPDKDALWIWTYIDQS